MSKQYVVAECVDTRDGQRYLPGDAFPDAPDDQIGRLTAAGCLSTEKPKAVAEGAPENPVPPPANPAPFQSPYSSASSRRSQLIFRSR